MRLALAYASPDGRGLLEFMLLLDRRLGSILVRTNEPLIGQMRMAWWRDVIAKEAGARPSGEPLIARLNMLEAEMGQPMLRPAMVRLLDAWETVIADRDWDANRLIKMSRERGEAIFSPYAERIGNTPQDRLDYWTTRWAVADLQIFCPDPDLRNEIASRNAVATSGRLPRKFRSASIMAHAAEGQGGFGGLKLLWHALTGY